MTLAPNPPPRGVELRVSDEDVALIIDGQAAGFELMLAPDLRNARTEIADLRAKLEAAEAETSRMLHRHVEFDGIRGEQLDEMFIRAKKAEVRADAAEAALREMTEQRDGARAVLRPFADEWNDSWSPEQNAGHQVADDETLMGGGGCSLTAGDLRRAAEVHAALAPPAETAAKEKRT